MTDSIEKIKVLVLGDSGVGKTSLVNLIANNNNKPSSWTVGCNLEVIYHQSPDYLEFIELWDVGGSLVHANSRSVFLRGSYHGIILVHDLTNSKSYTNMIKWAVECGQQGQDAKRLSREGESNLLKSMDIPKLIVGTKQDYLWSRSRYNIDRSGMMSHLNAQLISVNCLDHLQYKGSYQEQQIANFLDQVIKHKKTVSHRFNKPFRNTAEKANTSSKGLFSSLDLGFSF